MLYFPLLILGLVPVRHHLTFLERDKLFLEAHSDACLVTAAQYLPDSSAFSRVNTLGGWQLVTPRQTLSVGSRAESAGSSGRCFPSHYLWCNFNNKQLSTWGDHYAPTQMRGHSSFGCLIQRKLWPGATHRLCWGFTLEQHRPTENILRARNSSWPGHLHMTTPKLHHCSHTLRHHPWQYNGD